MVHLPLRSWGRVETDGAERSTSPRFADVDGDARGDVAAPIIEDMQGLARDASTVLQASTPGDRGPRELQLLLRFLRATPLFRNCGTRTCQGIAENLELLDLPAGVDLDFRIDVKDGGSTEVDVESAYILVSGDVDTIIEECGSAAGAARAPAGTLFTEPSKLARFPRGLTADDIAHSFAYFLHTRSSAICATFPSDLVDTVCLDVRCRAEDLHAAMAVLHARQPGQRTSHDAAVIANYLLRHDCFSDLPESCIKEVATQLTLHEIEPRRLLYVEDGPVRMLPIFVQGSVSAWRCVPSGDSEQLRHGSCFRRWPIRGAAFVSSARKALIRSCEEEVVRRWGNWQQHADILSALSRR